MKTHLSVKLKGICRPKEYVSFLETHFRDAVLDYESDPNEVKRLLEKDQWENRRIRRRGRDAIVPFTTSKERAKLKVEWSFE